jgi:ankyrin repeat protein
LNAQDELGRTALMWAAYMNQSETARLLVQAGASLEPRDIGGLTALGLAAKYGRKEIATLLLDAGADISEMERLLGGRPLLVWAAATCDTSLVGSLISKGADLEVRDRKGRTALLYVISKREFEMAAFLVRRGADVNGGDRKGRTPLMEAAVLGEVALVKMLVEAGADVQARTKDGFLTINFHPADPKADAEIQRILRQAGAWNPNDWKLAALALLFLGGLGALIRLFWLGRGGLRR